MFSTYLNPHGTPAPQQPLCEVARADNSTDLTDEPETRRRDLTEGRMAIQNWKRD